MSNYVTQICSVCGGEMEKYRMSKKPTCMKCQKKVGRDRNRDKYRLQKNYAHR